jgi:hypothetical protein
MMFAREREIRHPRKVFALIVHQVQSMASVETANVEMFHHIKKRNKSCWEVTYSELIEVSAGYTQHKINARGRESSNDGE